MLRIVLRNKGNGRVDAVYILEGHGKDGVYSLTAYWGRWGTYLLSKFTKLRYQVKYRGPCKLTLTARVRNICAEKMRNGYRVVEERSLLPEWPILPFGQNWRDAC